MPVPFETLIPYGIMIAMFGVTGTGLHVIKGIQNGGKKPVGVWTSGIGKVYTPGELNYRLLDLELTEMLTVMDRDRRLTGDLRGQIGNHEAPPGFELNNPWRLEKRIS
ncbi:uncharacterized protein ColSpa_04261 [Colletotrichum spaethianum]|uniref:NADH dehydrogenase [ubiquinone] 1 alpha subcomplex subunit 1 n=1 Tax=Colletotrichum spaethianum TaxID=700344 RepID=A0AA37LDN4_9PEZI|nr:uncharacterized protein ColSpa_04261 [Colletotrichum spaethianum]GKT44080.1 hypothetical protein ColSpa_04261 [Colletotrichum spaethianum]